MDTSSSITLLEFNSRIKRLLAHPSVQSTWVMAELSDVAVKGGHCYMELIQKEESSGRILAKNRAIIWANTYNKIRLDFEHVTRQPLCSGIKLMVEVSTNYHEQFGLSLIISNINPEYTLGDMERQRREILNRLAHEGIINMNRELPWPEVPQRIAIISAPGAAGYGDFMNQLSNNSLGIQFYTCLFSAVMQGERTVSSVTNAFDRINQHIDLFDCVVVIRGGGATSELHSFDNYDLAAYIAQFPIPVIVGIGHERDVTVLDYVAAMRVKTPTAAAEWLIARGENALAHMDELTEKMGRLVHDYISHANEQLAYLSSTIPLGARNVLENNRTQIKHFLQSIPLCVQNRISAAQTTLRFMGQNIDQAAQQRILREKITLKALEDKVSILSPRNTLNRGYSLTMCNGHAVTDASQINPGHSITTHLANGSVTSIVNNKK